MPLLAIASDNSSSNKQAAGICHQALAFATRQRGYSSRGALALAEQQLERQQLLLFGRVARQLEDSLMNKVTFAPYGKSLTPVTHTYVRKVGRPRAEWTTEVRKLALKAVGGDIDLKEAVRCAKTWRETVDAFLGGKW